MAQYTIEELYRGDKYNIMGKVAAEIMMNGIPADRSELQTQTELSLIRQTLLAAKQMQRDGDTIIGL